MLGPQLFQQSLHLGVGRHVAGARGLGPARSHNGSTTAVLCRHLGPLMAGHACNECNAEHLRLQEMVEAGK